MPLDLESQIILLTGLVFPVIRVFPFQLANCVLTGQADTSYDSQVVREFLLPAQLKPHLSQSGP